jgi:hypothetical protein
MNEARDRPPGLRDVARHGSKEGNVPNQFTRRLRPALEYLQQDCGQYEGEERLQRWFDERRELWICDPCWRRLRPSDREHAWIEDGRLIRRDGRNVVPPLLYLDPNRAAFYLDQAKAALQRPYRGRFQKVILPFLKKQFPQGVDHSTAENFKIVREMIVKLRGCEKISDQTLRRNLTNYNSTPRK